jgi:hypothetical protein
MALWAGNAEAAEKLKNMTGQPAGRTPSEPNDPSNPPPQRTGKPCGPAAPRH